MGGINISGMRIKRSLLRRCKVRKFRFRINILPNAKPPQPKDQ